MRKALTVLALIICAHPMISAQYAYMKYIPDPPGWTGQYRSQKVADGATNDGKWVFGWTDTNSETATRVNQMPFCYQVGGPSLTILPLLVGTDHGVVNGMSNTGVAVGSL